MDAPRLRLGNGRVGLIRTPAALRVPSQGPWPLTVKVYWAFGGGGEPGVNAGASADSAGEADSEQGVIMIREAQAGGPTQ